MADVTFVIGGNLGVGETDGDEIVPKYKEYGFDLVFHQIDLMEGLDTLEEFVR
jgi:methylaspartate mutase sigma subunit